MLKLMIAVFFLLTSSYSTPDIAVNRTYLTLTAGTSVSLALNESLDSETAEVGQTIELLVRNPVFVNGHEVIAKGAVAEGWVKDIKRACEMNCGFYQAKLVILAEKVFTVDGQQIYLRGIPFAVKGNGYQYTPAKAKLGTVVSSRVLNNVRINLDP